MQLAKLELIGFKSFADRTEFEFQPGVTAFVGPNGCGKSNVVDAVRWILGEQRPRVVRGKEMSDVIFKGTETRKSLGYAEASLTILNTKNLLPTEYHEICITRRLYRSGESEYFINRQPCRLRDIRELFMDTGIGAENYSIIEQGKVDMILQASPEERRIIFEEAAGISRYKAQRKEALRKLERTQNNIFLADQILAEKQKQLNAIRRQAAKARRYQSYCERLKELSVLLALRDYRELLARREEANAEIRQIQEQQRTIEQQVASREEALRQVEATFKALEQEFSGAQSRIHDLDSRASAAEEAIRANRLRISEFKEGAAQAAASAAELAQRLEATAARIESGRLELDAARDEVAASEKLVTELTQRIGQVESQLAQARRAIEAMRVEVFDVVRAQSGLRNEIVHIERNRRQQWSRLSRLQAEREEIAQKRRKLDEEDRLLSEQRDRAVGRLADHRAQLAANDQELRQIQEQLAAIQNELQEKRQTAAARESRRDVLRDLELRAEGVDRGVRRLLGGVAGIRGMVADLVRVDLPHAAAIEAALGDRAQLVVATDTAVAFRALQLLREEKAGRANVIPLDRVRPLAMPDPVILARPGVIGCASKLVRHDPDLADLVSLLLGDVLLVDTLDTALILAHDGAAPYRLVTLQGEIVEPTGVIGGGETLARSGLISRKSELDVVEREIGELAEVIGKLEWTEHALLQRAEHLRAESRALQQMIEEGNVQRATAETALAQHSRERQALAEQDEVAQMEIEDAHRSVEAANRQEESVRREIEAARRREEEVKIRVEEAERAIASQEATLNQLREELAQRQQEHAAKREQQARIEVNLRELEARLQDIRSQLEAARKQAIAFEEKSREAENSIATREQELVELRVAREQAASELQTIAQKRESLHAERTANQAEINRLREEHAQCMERINGLRLAESEHRMRIESLIERMAQEFGVNVPEVATQIQAAQEQDWEAIRAEIADLNQKVAAMRGTVNTETIREEEELELSVAEHTKHREDLLAAEKQLREVIRRINRISRERFQSTFEQIRQNFQEIFRKLFGGGQADIYLDPTADDILDAGIEIYACPPGKKRQPLSLLSGGEKTMTTVALLFAIFKSKPSPFCILDEVDAALDEKNIDRFAAMVQEFLKDSQFLIITHSKRTLSIADVMYGITMEEQGVSKKVAVKMENVREKVA